MIKPFYSIQIYAGIMFLAFLILKTSYNSIVFVVSAFFIITQVNWYIEFFPKINKKEVQNGFQNKKGSR